LAEAHGLQHCEIRECGIADRPIPGTKDLSDFLIDEIFVTFGLPPRGWHRSTLRLLFEKPAIRLSQLALEFDLRIRQRGILDAFQWVLPYFVKDVTAHNSKMIPRDGPLLVVANHPGTVDSLAIGASLPRKDLKIVSGPTPFTRSLPTFSRHLIYSSPDRHVRTAAVREAIRHLEAGGALLIFPRGRLEPDPAIQRGAGESIGRWSRSAELFRRVVPETRLVVAIASHVLNARFLHQPLAWVRKSPEGRQRVAEFVQTLCQLCFAKRFSVSPRITFSEVHRGSDADVIALAQQTFEQHVRSITQCFPRGHGIEIGTTLQ